MCFFFVFVNLIVISCNSTDDLDEIKQAVSGNVLLPTKLIYKTQTSTLSYDDQRRLVAFNEVEVDQLYSKVHILNYEQDVLKGVKVVYKSSEKEGSYGYTIDYHFNYDGNKIEVSSVFKDATGLEINEVYNLSVSNSGFLNNGNDVEVAYDQDYNLIELQSEGVETDFYFDNQNAIFKNINTPQWVFYIFFKEGMHKFNNPVKIVNLEIESNNEIISNFKYEYNSDGFPVKQHVSQSDSFTYELNIEYELFFL